jgi:ADP-ribose pyrophosphatase
MKDSKADVRSREIVYKGRIFTVEVSDVRLPHGPESRLEVVRHPGSVVLLPMPDGDHLILVKQYRFPVDRFLWEVPAGSLKPGEDPEHGAIRECQEETGLIPTVVQPLGCFLPTPGYCDEAMHFYRMSGLKEPGPGDAEAHQDDDEHLDVQAFSLADVRRMVRSGEIVDLKTAVALVLLG